jgi:Tol biopolymer transport system component
MSLQRAVMSQPFRSSQKKITIWGYGAGIRVSPDGKTLVFAGHTVQEGSLNRLNIRTLSTEGGQPKRITVSPSGFTDRFPSWSPDGQDIVFVREKLSDAWSTPEEGNIFVVSSKGGEPRKITWESDRIYSTGPVLWSPDGQLLAFFSRDKDKVEGALCVIRPTGGKLRPVTAVESIHANKEFAWSPDSKRIALQGSEEGVIKIISLEDGNVREIKVDLPDTKIYHLDWSPDGKTLVFGGYTGGGPELWMIEDFLPLVKQ